MTFPTRLPKPDEHGNYYLRLDEKRLPAIFPFKTQHGKGEDIVNHGTWTALVSAERGFLCEAGDRIYFKTPALALAALREVME